MRTEPSFSSEPDDDLLNKSQHSAPDFEHDEPGPQLLADYRQRYGVSADPFADDHHFPFYTGAQRRQVLDQLLHLCQFSNNLLVVLGEYGVGKTRMAQALIDSLDDADDICFIEGQIDATFDSLIENIFDQFELSDADAFENFSSKEINADGLAVIIIDNAHHIADDSLSQLISFVCASDELRVHLVLLAEPHLLSRLEGMEVQDIALSEFFLNKFSLSEATDYLNFRMEMADYLGPEIFTENKVEPWWRQSQGQLLPLHEFAQHELLSAVTPPKKFTFTKKALPLPHIIGASVLGAVLLMGGIYWGGGSSANKTSQLSQPVPIGNTGSQMKIESNQSSQAASQESSNISIATNATNTSAIQNINSATTVSSAIAVSSSAPVQSLNHEEVVKQRVVPLVQANMASQSIPTKSSKASAVSSSAKENKKTEIAQDEVKASAKTDIKADEKIKPVSAIGNFTEQEKLILSWDPAEFTLQLVGLSTEKAVHEFIAAQPNKKDLLVFKGVRQGKDWFVVVTGRYPTSTKARQAIEQLPESQKKAAPWPREIKIIQKEIKSKLF